MPKSIRRSVYTDLIEQFRRSNMQNAKIDGAKVSAAISLRKAIAGLALENVVVVTVNGELYLSKK